MSRTADIPGTIRIMRQRVTPSTTALLVAIIAAQLCALLPDAVAQHSPREVRAVWLTTLLGLDWPDAALRGNAAAQKQALRAILDDLREKKYNTVFFQVRSRGNAFYRSALEPWAGEVSGQFGKDPGWDPLAFAIEECHARGLQLHAWFNVCRVWSKGEPPASVPMHVARAHPEWVQRFGEDLWIDPGLPAARQFTVRVAEDLVRNYAIDGLHLDYVRYPDRGFRDGDTYRRSGSGKNLEDWRRDNVSALVREMYERCTAVRPSLQFGSAPIGIYQNLPTARGWEGRNAISQDSRRWLREGYHDYVAPQIYWGLTRKGSGIDFEALVADWTRESSSRQVIAGVAAYKENVQSWLAEHVDAIRAQGADGVVFFRYAHVRGNALGGRFDQRAIPPAMPWRDAIRPNPPRRLRHEAGRLTWDAPVPASDGDTATWYAVYRMHPAAGAETLVALLPASQRHWPITASAAATDASEMRSINQSVMEGHQSVMEAHQSVMEAHAVTALDAFWNESAVSGTAATLASIAGPADAPAPSIPVFVPRISAPIAAGDATILLGFELDHASFVRLRLMDGNGAELLVLVDGWQGAGTHIVGIERERMPDDMRRVIFEAGETRHMIDFLVE